MPLFSVSTGLRSFDAPGPIVVAPFNPLPTHTLLSSKCFVLFLWSLLSWFFVLLVDFIAFVVFATPRKPWEPQAACRTKNTSATRKKEQLIMWLTHCIACHVFFPPCVSIVRPGCSWPFKVCRGFCCFRSFLETLKGCEPLFWTMETYGETHIACNELCKSHDVFCHDVDVFLVLHAPCGSHSFLGFDKPTKTMDTTKSGEPILSRMCFVVNAMSFTGGLWGEPCSQGIGWWRYRFTVTFSFVCLALVLI